MCRRTGALAGCSSSLRHGVRSTGAIYGLAAHGERFLLWIFFENSAARTAERTRDRSSEAAKARPEITYSDDVGLDRREEVRPRTQLVTFE